MKSSKTIDQNAYRKSGMDALYLSGCALHGRCPEMRTEVDLSALYKFCKAHNITSIVAMALEDYWRNNPSPDAEQMTVWKQEQAKAIRKNILLNNERERLLQYLESIGCWYMPLKGSLLQFDYPKFGMRQMSDNDILFDVTKQNEIYEYMCSNQYTPVRYRKGHHDEYTKPPIYHFEMHHCLFHSTDFPVLSEYYKNIKEIFIKDEGNRFGYHFSDSDFYIYLIVHAYKHYSLGGTGVRHLMDVYVYLNAHKQNLNWTYIEEELRKLNIWEFESDCRHLSEKLYADPKQTPELSEQQKQMLDYFIFSGTYGTQKNRIDHALQNLQEDGDSFGNGTKIRYILSRLFPSVDLLAVEDPDLINKKWKIPFVLLKRLFSAIFRNPQKTIREIITLIKAKPSSD